MYGIKNSLEMPKQANINQFNVDLDIKTIETDNKIELIPDLLQLGNEDDTNEPIFSGINAEISEILDEIKDIEPILYGDGRYDMRDNKQTVSEIRGILNGMNNTTLEQEPTITFNSQTGISMVANEIAPSIQLEDKIDDLPESNYIKFKGDLLSEYLKYRKECRKSKMEYDNYVLVDLDDGEGFVHQLVNVNSIDSGDVKNINTGATQHITCISRDWKVKCNVIPAKNKNVLDTLIQVASNLYVKPEHEATYTSELIEYANKLAIHYLPIILSNVYEFDLFEIKPVLEDLSTITFLANGKYTITSSTLNESYIQFPVLDHSMLKLEKGDGVIKLVAKDYLLGVKKHIEYCEYEYNAFLQECVGHFTDSLKTYFGASKVEPMFKSIKSNSFYGDFVVIVPTKNREKLRESITRGVTYTALTLKKVIDYNWATNKNSNITIEDVLLAESKIKENVAKIDEYVVSITKPTEQVEKPSLTEQISTCLVDISNSKSIDIYAEFKEAIEILLGELTNSHVLSIKQITDLEEYRNTPLSASIDSFRFDKAIKGNVSKDVLDKINKVLNPLNMTCQVNYDELIDISFVVFNGLINDLKYVLLETYYTKQNWLDAFGIETKQEHYITDEDVQGVVDKVEPLLDSAILNLSAYNAQMKTVYDWVQSQLQSLINTVQIGSKECYIDVSNVPDKVLQRLISLLDSLDIPIDIKHNRKGKAKKLYLI